MAKTSSVSGVDGLEIKLGDLGKALSGENLGEVVMAGALVLEGVIKISMGEQKHGRTYGSHVASAPGEAPAIEMGALVNTIRVELASSEAGSASAIVGTNAEYGEELEFGTARMKPRPFLRPAADQHQQEVNEAATITAKRLIDEATNA